MKRRDGTTLPISSALTVAVTKNESDGLWYAHILGGDVDQLTFSDTPVKALFMAWDSVRLLTGFCSFDNPEHDYTRKTTIGPDRKPAIGCSRCDTVTALSCFDNPLSIGFTGTRHGMTNRQRAKVLTLVQALVDAATDDALVATGLPSVVGLDAHHGDCIGADAQFHSIIAMWNAWIVVHPGPANDAERQAGCEGHERRPHAGHMARNRNIVDASTVMIAAPHEATEQQRGGTWATIRMAQKAGKPLAIVLPSGEVVKERWR
jgi:hypothetical protein